jgi:hypothetical protein
MTSSSTKHPLDRSSGCGSSFKNGMIIPHESVDEESSDSDDEDQEMQQEEPTGEQSPRQMD